MCRTLVQRTERKNIIMPDTETIKATIVLNRIADRRVRTDLSSRKAPLGSLLL